MDQQNLAGLLLYLFLAAFPTSVCLWAWLLVANGFVRRVPAMPWEFRKALLVTGAKRDGHQSVAL